MSRGLSMNNDCEAVFLKTAKLRVKERQEDEIY